MQAADGLVAETVVLHVLVSLHPPMRLGFVVEFLELQGRERRQPYFSDARHDMLVNVVLIVCRRDVYKRQDSRSVQNLRRCNQRIGFFTET